MPSFLEVQINPLWRIVTMRDVAHAPTIYDFDANGFASPSPGHQLSSEQADDMNRYNAQRATLPASNRALVDDLMERVLPLTDFLYNPLNDADAFQASEDLSWLLDHEQGSDFYNDTANFEFDPNGDIEAGHRQARLDRLLELANADVDTQEISNRVNSGISSPIVIDLAGDGIDTTSRFAGETVLFDINGDGAKDRTAWLSGKDAFLAVDRNKNGIIDGVNEMFGGAGRGDGFAELADFDSNGDGVVDKTDANFSDLLLWQDGNMDGVSDQNELQTALNADLSSISTEFRSQEVFESGNLLGEVSRAVYQGREVDAVDVYFRFKAVENQSRAADDIDIAPLVSAMASFSAAAPGGSVATLSDQPWNMSLSAAIDIGTDKRLVASIL